MQVWDSSWDDYPGEHPRYAEGVLFCLVCDKDLTRYFASSMVFLTKFTNLSSSTRCTVCDEGVIFTNIYYESWKGYIGTFLDKDLIQLSKGIDLSI
jgi:hypothetical protein